MSKKQLTKDKNSGSDWEMWGIPYFGGGKDEVLKRVASQLKTDLVSFKKPFWIATVNPEFVMRAESDNKFKKLLIEKTDMNVVDGIGLVWARQSQLDSPWQNSGQLTGLIQGWWIIKKCLKGIKTGVEVLRGGYKNEVVAGSSLIGDFCSLAKKKNYRVFFLGGWGNRAERTAKFFEEKYKGLKTDWSEGEPEVKNAEVLVKINKFKPHFLLVAYGMKRQEEWIAKNMSKLKVGVVMGVGRSFDYYSADLQRAPVIWRDMGLEWLYSLIKEPKRWKRQLALPRFAMRVIRDEGEF